jgi:hypothetical protein
MNSLDVLDAMMTSLDVVPLLARGNVVDKMYSVVIQLCVMSPAEM